MKEAEVFSSENFPKLGQTQRKWLNLTTLQPYKNDTSRQTLTLHIYVIALMLPFRQMMFYFNKMIMKVSLTVINDLTW